MNPAPSVAVATWILQRLTFGSPNDALLGDLLEELRDGRSANWYWRQVLCAIGIRLLNRFRGLALPLVFSIAWSLLYPAWSFAILKLLSTSAELERWAAIDWPYSTALRGIAEVIPAVAFLWLGFFLYLLLRAEIAHRLSSLALLASLSISLNVLLITIISLRLPSRPPEIGWTSMTRQGLYFDPHGMLLAVPLALSLLSAISFALARAQTQPDLTAPGTGSL